MSLLIVLLSVTLAGAQSSASYPNSTAGLERMMTHLMTLQMQGGSEELSRELSSLEIPNAESWFASRFGTKRCAEGLGENDCIGPRLALTYESKRAILGASFTKTLNDFAGEHLTNFEAVNESAACAQPLHIVPSPELVGDLTTTLAVPTLRGREPVYVVWAFDRNVQTTLGFFVYVDGAFRYLGRLYPAPPVVYEKFRQDGTRLPEETEPHRLNDRNVQAAGAMADPQMLERLVLVQVEVDKNGKPINVTFAGGAEQFKDSAITQVKKRKFDPPGFGAGGFQPNVMCLKVEGK